MLDAANLFFKIDVLVRKAILQRGNLAERERILERESDLLGDLRDQPNSSLVNGVGVRRPSERIEHTMGCRQRRVADPLHTRRHDVRVQRFHPVGSACVTSTSTARSKGASHDLYGSASSRICVASSSGHAGAVGSITKGPSGAVRR